ncbi:ADP-dependent glucokinase/phosphofructokinase [Ruania zhangjianzhongii]|uniref:ADP-dependent glucokinase/phosphofructokinase n=1 Tax=Ruania zhangjianzhongii TaxID=2603206 RepID=UPI0011D2238B|nr:ADP-dependent glucokinase/phosphofructokinase [Ruania zhangjianzhongii]
MTETSYRAARTVHEWAGFYHALVVRRSALVAGAGPIVTGFSATTDALHRITGASLTRLLTAGPSGSEIFDAGLGTLGGWLAEGRDGELFIDDVGGEPLLEALVGMAEKVQCGGTSVQASWSWSQLGLHPLLALLNRNPRQLGATPAGVRLATADGGVPVHSITPVAGMSVPSNHVLELSAGLTGAGVQVQRSSRITVVFARKRLQLDEAFLRISPSAVRGGVGMVSGLNGLGRAREKVLPIVADTVAAWNDGGARLVHLELAEYASPGELAQVMTAVGPHVHSVGMNASELERLVGGGDPAQRAAEFAAAHGLLRVVVHGDHWAMSVHRADPEREELALGAGSLAAANRAANGEPQAEWAVPVRARFSSELPVAGRLDGGYRMTIVATPYLTTPRSTIGLGDTFVSGDLLVQANPSI